MYLKAGCGKKTPTPSCQSGGSGGAMRETKARKPKPQPQPSEEEERRKVLENYIGDLQAFIENLKKWMRS
jgi:hypothetical protein